jgi:hypothetical protein
MHAINVCARGGTSPGVVFRGPELCEVGMTVAWQALFYGCGKQWDECQTA